MEWNLDKRGSLTIQGTGKMENYSAQNRDNIPWEDVKMQIKKIVIEDGITELGSYAWEGCENLKKVVLPKSVRRIRTGCFKNCTNLKEVITDSGVKLKYLHDKSSKLSEQMIRFGMESFYNTPWAMKKWGEYYICDDVLYTCFAPKTEIVIPDHIRVIEKFAFRNVPVEKVTFPDSLEEIGVAAFENTQIKEIYITKNVKKIDAGAFSGSNLRYALLSHENKAYHFDKNSFAGTRVGKVSVSHKICLRSCRGGASNNIYKKVMIAPKELFMNEGRFEVESFNAFRSIYRRIRRGSVFACISYDEAEKRITKVTAYANRKSDSFCGIVQYGYILKKDEMDEIEAIWDRVEEKYDMLDGVAPFMEGNEVKGRENQIKIFEEGGLRDNGQKENWYWMSHSWGEGNEYFVSDVVNIWLKQHPGYRI